MSHSAEKCKRGDPFLIYKHAFCCKITKKLKGGTLWDIKKFSKKSRTVPKKIKRGDPLVSAGFVGYVKKVKNERRDSFALIYADRTWPYGSLEKNLKFSKIFLFRKMSHSAEKY